MLRKYLIISGILLILPIQIFSQDSEFKVASIGFYNFENLFDTVDQVDVEDEEFTPTGPKLWNTEKYKDKLARLARVVSEVGTDLTPDGLALLGVSEIENRSVLEDFVKEEAIADRKYRIIHEDSPDERGIDVALLYNPKYFRPLQYRSLRVDLPDRDGQPNYTRDVLYVHGTLDGEPIHLFVNHWPSRSGGERATMELRKKAAGVCKQLSDSIVARNPKAKIFIMGDLNDDPVSPSVRDVLHSEYKIKRVDSGAFYNPMYRPFKQGSGTLAYRDAWNVFDQILVSYGALRKAGTEGYHFYKMGIFNPRYLRQKTGNYKGYPFRTFGGDEYLGGFSDHFPVYIHLIAKK